MFYIYALFMLSDALKMIKINRNVSEYGLCRNIILTLVHLLVLLSELFINARTWITLRWVNWRSSTPVYTTGFLAPTAKIYHALQQFSLSPFWPQMSRRYCIRQMARPCLARGWRGKLATRENSARSYKCCLHVSKTLSHNLYDSAVSFKQLNF